MHPAPGDYFVTRTNGFIAAAICWATNGTVNHAGIYVGHVNGYTKPQVIEARPGGAGYRDADAYPQAVWSTGRLPAALTPTAGQRIAIVAAAHDSLGTPYGFWDIAAIALAQKRLGSRVSVVKALKDQPWWVKRIMSQRTEICSQAVALADSKAGINLFTDGRLPGLVSPQDLRALLTT